MNSPWISRSLVYVALVCGFAIVLDITGLRLPEWLTVTTIAWGLVVVMFLCGIIVPGAFIGGFSRTDVAKGFAISGALAVVGIVIRVATTDASPVDLALMLIDRDEYLGARLQLIGYGLIAGLLAIAIRRLFDSWHKAPQQQ